MEREKERKREGVTTFPRSSPSPAFVLRQRLLLFRWFPVFHGDAERRGQFLLRRSLMSFPLCRQSNFHLSAGRTGRAREAREARERSGGTTLLTLPPSFSFLVLFFPAISQGDVSRLRHFVLFPTCRRGDSWNLSKEKNVTLIVVMQQRRRAAHFIIGPAGINTPHDTTTMTP